MLSANPSAGNGIGEDLIAGQKRPLTERLDHEKSNLFDEMMEGMDALKAHREGKLTLNSTPRPIKLVEKDHRTLDQLAALT